MSIKVRSFTKKRHFGVELELLTSGVTQNRLRDIIAETDGKHPIQVSGWQATQNNGFWHVKTDSTCGYEVASYKARGFRDVVTICKVAEALHNADVKIDRKCGLHLHVEVRDFNVNQMAALVAYWLKIEPVIFYALPDYRRNNIYCRSCREGLVVPAKALSQVNSFWTAVCPTGISHVFRRKTLNICNYVFNPGRMTVEFRMPESTFDPYEVKNWIRFLVNFVHFVKKQPYPGNIEIASLAEMLQIVGLAGDGIFYILSSGLVETKQWILQRIISYSPEKSISRQAMDLLNKMWNPIKRFEMNENCEQYVEFV
jgi:hypothetical protein